MAYPVSIDYRKGIEKTSHFLHGLPYAELHPEQLAYEEVQRYDGWLLGEVWIENVRDECLSQAYDVTILKGIFSDILENIYVKNGMAKRWDESEEGLLYNKSAIVKRLENEGNTREAIVFYLSMVYKLQQTILERMDAVRILIDWLENPKMYKGVEWLSMFSPGNKEMEVRTRIDDYPIEITQLFRSPGDCVKFFADGDGLSCAQWARRLYEHEKTGLFSYTVQGDYKTVYNQIKAEHPRIAGIESFHETLRRLRNI